MPVTSADVQGGKTMIHTVSDVLIPPSLVESKTAHAAATAKSSAASLAAGVLALGLPAVMAALL